MSQATQEQILSAISTLQTEVQRQHDEITQLRARLATAPRPRHCLPEPEKFNGQSFKFDTWLPSIKAKLRVDNSAIGDEAAQFYYVFLNLESNVQAMVLPQLTQAEEANSYDFQSILDQLARVYDNPNKVQEAEDRLFSIKQGSDSLHAYMAKFERILYEAQGQDWPDVNKISTFRNGLHSTIRNRLSQQLNLPRTYADFIRVVQQLAGRSTTFSHADATATKSSSYGNQHSDKMDINSLQISTISKTHSPPGSPRRARSLSPARRQQLRDQGRCVRCGSHDHWVKDCSLDPYSSASGSGRKVTVMAMDDDSDDVPSDQEPESASDDSTEYDFNDPGASDLRQTIKYYESRLKERNKL